MPGAELLRGRCASNEQLIFHPGRMVACMASDHRDSFVAVRREMQVDTAQDLNAEALRDEIVKGSPPPVTRLLRAREIDLNPHNGPPIIDTDDERSSLCIQKRGDGLDDFLFQVALQLFTTLRR